MAEQVEMKAKVVQSEVKAVTARHKKALEERECELLWKVMLPQAGLCRTFASFQIFQKCPGGRMGFRLSVAYLPWKGGRQEGDSQNSAC